MIPGNLPFEYPFRWRNEDLASMAGVTPEAAALLDQRDRDLEDFLAGLGGGANKPYATIVVAPSDCQAAGAASADYVLPGDAAGDTAMLTEALNALHVGNWWEPDYHYRAKVLVLDGTVNLNDALPDVTHLQGMGMGATRFLVTGTINSVLFDGDTFSDFSVIGSATPHVDTIIGADSEIRGVSVHGFDATTEALTLWGFGPGISNVYVFEVGKAITVSGTGMVSNAVIEDCGTGVACSSTLSLSAFYISGCAVGVDVNGTAVVAGGTIRSGAGSTGINNNDQCEVTGVLFESTDSAGPDHFIYNNSGGMTVNGCRFGIGSGVGFHASSSQDNRIQNCFFETGSPGALAISGYLQAGNMVTGCSFTAAYVDGWLSPIVSVDATAPGPVAVGLNYFHGFSSTAWLDDPGGAVSTGPGNWFDGVWA